MDGIRRTQAVTSKASLTVMLDFAHGAWDQSSAEAIAPAEFTYTYRHKTARSVM